MRPRDALSMAAAILAELGLDGWTVGLDRAKRRLGLCRHGDRVITLSHHYVLGNSEDRVRATVLHEAAHALVGPGHGHGPVWKRTAERLGIAPERCTAADGMPAGRYILRCDRCGRDIGRRHRRGRTGGRYTHVGCGGFVEWLDTGITSVVR